MFYAISWGVVAAAMAFWMNELVQGFEREFLCTVLFAPVIEETAKYLGIRAVRRWSLLVPLTFMVGEVVVRWALPMFMVTGSERMLVAVVLYSLVGLFTLKHILTYVPMYLLDCKLYSLPLAIVLHAVWNWYVMAGQDTLPVGLIALATVILAPMALYKFRRTDD